MRLNLRTAMLFAALVLPLLLTTFARAASDFDNEAEYDDSAITLSSQSPHKLFMSADSTSGEQFDEWRMDTGYAYSVLDNIDLFVATRISNSGDNQPNRGFLSGVNYQLNQKLSLNSAIYTSADSKEERITDSMGAELSGKYMLTESLNLKATLDYEDWQSAIEVKLGFSF
ncbi:hypothetical protein [Vibrio superstes]|uniref:Uncharacterized protein n=1 Tax=Vibrio superstes NBRC 103154 TaxID=1219062 RepID=A0A511QM69_9VIBR|nr:hypothetical protein [Vibrio superstes]GEM78428.1 hypothetical protein VSU01S_06730 [Vibrio superstes NBRC 103154]